MADRGSPRRIAARLVLGALLAFLGAITVGNAPYPFLGYGLSAFAVFTLGLTYPPKEAVAAFVIGTVAGAAVDLRSASVFLFVGAGAAVVRTIQIVLLVRLRPRAGDLGSSLVVLLVGVFLAIAVGLATYGGEGIMPAFAVFDVVYLPPAWLLARIAQSEASPGWRMALTALIVGGTLVAFASAAAFLLLVPLIAALLVLILAGVLALRGHPHAHSSSRSIAETAGPAAVLVVLFALLLVSGPALGYAVRSLGYPLYPDSLGAQQWIASAAVPPCKAGNLAGGGTEESGVWSPARLRVLSTCITVTGVIEALAPTSGPAVDGDYSLDLGLDPGYAWTLSLGSYVLNGGLLHVEVVPSDQPSVFANLTLTPGEHVQVTGVWVLDTDHGWWSEIHPAWSIVPIP